MRKLTTALAAGIAVAGLVAFTPPGDKKPKYIDKANMDLSVKPGENFYLYANGSWLRKSVV